MGERKKVGEKHTKYHTYGVYEERVLLTLSTKYHVYDEDTRKRVAGPFSGREEAYRWIEEQKVRGK